jgi:hypothetical protein
VTKQYIYISVYAVLRIVSFGQWSSLIGGEHCHLQNVDPIFYLNAENSFFGSFCSLKSSASSTTNYPGKIPHGLDLPNDVATEKHPEKGVTN